MDEIEVLECAIEAMVLLQYGASPLLSSMECSECSEEEKIANGCCLGNREITYLEEPLVIKHTNSEYHNCPISLIPPVVYEMMDKYTRVKELNQTLNDNETPCLYWWFTKTYNRIKGEVERIIHEEAMKKNK